MRSRPVVRTVLACPRCTGRLQETAHAYTCLACSAAFPIVDGLPVFVDESVAQHDELDHHGSHSHQHTGPRAHKAAQAAYFDRNDLAEFEIERPVGAPALYRFLLEEKLRRSIEPLGESLDGWTALTVCGGSGLDAEYLALKGASVISSDLSLEAARRVRERARRHGVAITPIVADVEHLPFPDQSVDLVLVHDGLHHLENPAIGLAEMARVARRAVCVTEPADAAATSLAVHLGLALDREEAGNRVARLNVKSTTATLEAAGFRTVRADRYAMYYKHVPGRLTQLLSRRPIFDWAILGWHVADRTIGRFGNKLTIVAIR